MPPRLYFRTKGQAIIVACRCGASGWQLDDGSIGNLGSDGQYVSDWCDCFQQTPEERLAALKEWELEEERRRQAIREGLTQCRYCHEWKQQRKRNKDLKPRDDPDVCPGCLGAYMEAREQCRKATAEARRQKAELREARESLRKLRRMLRNERPAASRSPGGELPPPRNSPN